MIWWRKIINILMILRSATMLIILVIVKTQIILMSVVKTYICIWHICTTSMNAVGSKLHIIAFVFCCINIHGLWVNLFLDLILRRVIYITVCIIYLICWIILKMTLMNLIKVKIAFLAFRMNNNRFTENHIRIYRFHIICQNILLSLL